MSKIVVVGSISMDLVMETNRIAEEGETVFGERFSIVPGGKGANQAVAVGRLKPEKVTMLGAVGEDAFGSVLKENLKSNNIFVDNVGTFPSSSGIAQITIFNKDNRIIYCPGANGLVDTSSWSEEWDVIDEANLVILQNEIPHSANLEIAKRCYKNGVKVLYNPAPARNTDFEMIEYVDYITPNQHECKELFPENTLEEVLCKYPNKLIVTLGTKGSTYFDGNIVEVIPALKVDAVDTTGAGDTFNGSFGFAISEGLELKEALKFATICSSLSVQKFGAQGGMPTIEEVKEHEVYEKTWNFK